MQKMQQSCYTFCMTFETIFTRLGYPKHSARIYEALTKESGAYLVTQIAKKTNLPRMTVYRVLTPICADNIVVRGISGKRITYQVAHPSVLEKLLSHETSETNRTLAKLKKSHKNVAPANIRFLFGREGITEAFDDVITHTHREGIVYRYTSEKNLSEVNAYLAPDYRKRRDAKKLERLVISNPVSGSQKQKRLERFIRYIPADVDRFDQNIIQFVYGSRVSFIDITKQEVMIIENAALATFQKVIFKQLYKKLDRD